MKKKFVALFLSATVLAGPLFAAGQAAADDHRGPMVVHKKMAIKKHRWQRGHRVTVEERRSFRAVDYRRYRLAAPPRGYHWVRADGDFLLVGITTGLISSIIAAR